MYLLVMLKYWGKQIFTHGRFPEVGQKQKTEKKKKEKKRKKDRTMAITMAKLRMAHASTHGARKHAWRTQAAWAKSSGGVLVQWGCHGNSVKKIVSRCLDNCHPILFFLADRDISMGPWRNPSKSPQVPKRCRPSCSRTFLGLKIKRRCYFVAQFGQTCNGLREGFI